MESRVRLLGKLRHPVYRKNFVRSRISFGISFQIRSLMKERGWSQEELARRTGMLQPRISAILNPGKSKPNVETLRRIAEAFDIGLEVRFASFSDLVEWSENFDPDNFSVPSFGDDSGFIEKRDMAVVDTRRQRVAK